jgi:hypothetical protein
MTDTDHVVMEISELRERAHAVEHRLEQLWREADRLGERRSAVERGLVELLAERSAP